MTEAGHEVSPAWHQRVMDYLRRPWPWSVYLPVAAVVALAFQRRWVAEDAYINFRVVDQLLAGNGPVFNAGERVEVATSTIWLVMLVPGRLLPGVGVEVWSVFLGLVVSACGLLLAAKGSSLLWSSMVSAKGGRVEVPVGLVAIAALPPTWDWATSGLENCLTTAWIGGSIWALGRIATRVMDTEPNSPPIERSLPVIIGMGVLIRPDLVVLTGFYLLAALVLLRHRGSRSIVRFMGLAMIAPVLYEVFRAGYYGSLLPNTVLVKDASGAYWDEGLNYLTDFANPYMLWVPGLAVALVLVANSTRIRAGGRDPLAALILCLAGALVYGLAVIRGGGDYMHARLLLPALYGLLIPAAVVPLSRRRNYASLAALGGSAVVVVWAAVCAISLRPDVGEGIARTSYGMEDERLRAITLGQNPTPISVEGLDSWYRFGGEAITHRHEMSPGDLLHPDVYMASNAAAVEFREFPAGIGRDGRTVVIHQAMGVMAYSSPIDVFFVDRLGLADPIGARGEAWMPRAGHRKLMSIEMQLARGADPDAAIPRGAIEYNPLKLEAAREVLECGDVRELLDAVQEPLTPSRFLRNIIGSPKRTFLEIPRHPREAHEKFC